MIQQKMFEYIQFHYVLMDELYINDIQIQMDQNLQAKNVLGITKENQLIDYLMILNWILLEEFHLMDINENLFSRKIKIKSNKIY